MNSHYQDKTVVGPSYLCNGNPTSWMVVFILKYGSHLSLISTVSHIHRLSSFKRKSVSRVRGGRCFCKELKSSHLFGIWIYCRCCSLLFLYDFCQCIEINLSIYQQLNLPMPSYWNNQDSLDESRLTKIGVWISNYISGSFTWDVITHPCSFVNGGWT